MQEIAQELKISRTTVRKYLNHPEAVIRKPRPPRPSKLDPFKEQISKWVTEDHCTNCEVIFARLKQRGYTGQLVVAVDLRRSGPTERAARTGTRGNHGNGKLGFF